MKKLCSIILAAAMSFISVKVPQYSFNSVNAETKSTVSVWDEKKDTSWYDEEETEFHLTTAQEFAGLATLINSSGISFEGKTIYLESDLNMSSKILPPFLHFKGTLDGQYHSISKYYSSNQGLSSIDHSGLFSSLEGKVCNLKLDITSSTFLSSYNGGICGALQGGTIENCFVTGKISTSPLSTMIDPVLFATGGICGKSISGTITGCASSVDIRASVSHSNKPQSYAGGICGICEGDTVISNSYFTGKIDNYTYLGSTTNPLPNSYTGGIIGKIKGKATISNVYNTGTLVKYAVDNSGSIKAAVIGVCDEAELTGSKIYYLSSTSTYGVGIGEEVAIAKSDANMKKESFAESLGSAFIYKENRYPPLGWEYGYTEPIVTTTTTTSTTTTTTTTTTTKPTTTTTTSTTTTTAAPTTMTTTSTTPTTTISPSTTTSTVLTTTSSTTSTSTSTTQKTTTITTTTANEEFKLEVTSITIKNGNQYTIPINRADIVFKSTNPDVAVVSPKGIVTAIGTGEAVINVIDKDYNVIQLKVSVQSDVVYSLGDVNNDGQINAVDASTVLSYYAMISTNKDGGFDDKQKGTADVNKDGLINAVDASCILSYYAYTSTTKDTTKKTLEEFLKS